MTFNKMSLDKNKIEFKSKELKQIKKSRYFIFVLVLLNVVITIGYSVKFEVLVLLLGFFACSLPSIILSASFI
jgi:hypothetical protein